MTEREAASRGPSGREASQARLAQAAAPERGGNAGLVGVRTPTKAAYCLAVAALTTGGISLGLGVTDMIRYRILTGYLVALGMSVGLVAALLASITWFAIVAPKTEPGRQTEMIRRICRAGQLLGFLGFICLAIGSGNGNAL